MHKKNQYQLRKIFSFIVLISLVTLFFWGASFSPSAYAQGVESATPAAADANRAYFTSQTIILGDGTRVDKSIINGPSQPPKGYELSRSTVALLKPNLEAGINSLTVPAFNWSFGCSATSGAMIAAYYDRNGYPNMYTGPKNGGVMPLDSSVWPNWSDGSRTFGQCPLTASHQGLDGRTTRGSIDDYWVSVNSTAPDPYINHWAVHAWGDAIGDYMKTSQSTYGNVDGATTFYTWITSPAPLTCSDMESNYITKDGTYGRKLFYEAKGYSVTDCFNQMTDNNGGGFTFAMYKAQIDAGRPVMVNLKGHTVVGVGYDNATNTVYLHDTWDYLTHSMTWGGSYSNMPLYSVSIVNITGANPLPAAFGKTAPTNGATGQTTHPTLSWETSSGATSYDYCYDTTNDNACSNWTSASTNTSINLSGLNPGIPYYWQVRANNNGGATYANGSDIAFWSFTTLPVPPAAFGKTAPTNGAAGLTTSPTLSWGVSNGAASYEYCYDSTNDNACSSWTSTSTNTSVHLIGLSSDLPYYWQVRAINSGGTTYANDSATAFWSFTPTSNPPHAFGKISPAIGAPDQSTIPTLSWETSSGASRYEYCYIINDIPCSAWTSTGLSNTVESSDILPSTIYWWEVRAVNDVGVTYANSNSWWYFTTVSASFLPGSFNKTGPTTGATGLSTHPTLTWTASSGATSYKYCIDTTNDSTCSGPWVNAGNTTQISLSGLSGKTTYYWEIRAGNAMGNTLANGGAWWSLTTDPLRVFLPALAR